MMDEGDFLSIQKAAEVYGISSSIIRQWDRAGKIECRRNSANWIVLRRKDLEAKLGIHRDDPETSQSPKKNICYCRVSSRKQKDDLERQKQSLGTLYPSHVLVEDIASGVNFNRKGLQTILEHALKGNLGEVVVAHRDRLTRFGFDLVESIIEKSGGVLTVLNDEKGKSREEELSEDITTLIHVYNCHKMGKRRYSTHKEPKDQNQTK